MTAFRKVIEEGFSGGNESVIDEYVADDFVEHQYGMEPANAEGTKRAIRFLHRLAPDFQLVIEDLVEAGDCVWGRTGTGTHAGSTWRVFQGVLDKYVDHYNHARQRRSLVFNRRADRVQRRPSVRSCVANGLVG